MADGVSADAPGVLCGSLPLRGNLTPAGNQVRAPAVKKSLTDLALFGGAPAFAEVRSTSNLVQPDIETFFAYARRSFDSRRLTNNGPLVQLLEVRLAELHQARFCVSFCNGLWGLVLAMACLAKEGCSEIIMPSLTYRRMADIAA